VDAQSYAGVSEVEFAVFVKTYRELCSNTPWIYLLLAVDTCAKVIPYSSWLEAALQQPVLPLLVLLLVMMAAGLPLLIYFVITLCRLPPPMTPRAFRHFLLFAMLWHVVGTAVLSSIALIAPADVASLTVKVAAFVSEAASLLVLPILLKHHNRLRDHEGGL
jgi:hypothetical protein